LTSAQLKECHDLCMKIKAAYMQKRKSAKQLWDSKRKPTVTKDEMLNAV